MRPLERSDRTDVLKILTDPQLTSFYRGEAGEERADRWIANREFFACILKDTGEFIGVCGLISQMDIDGLDEIEVGYHFIRKFWGQGYATEAALACLEYGFNEKGYKRIISLIEKDNKASIRVAEKNGLKKEKEVLFKGRLVSVYVI